MPKVPPGTRVAYLGPPGTYSHAAAQQWFAASAAWQPVTDIQDVFTAVETGAADYGVVPVENSNEGSVTATLDGLSASPLGIEGELMLRIRHCLLVGADTVQSAITRVVSHQQSLGQCRHWLATNLPGIERLAVSSNAEAARLAARQPGVAAIAGRAAADLYGLAVLAESIEDCHDNTTRFLLLGQGATASPSAHDKTSLIISTHNEPGTLFQALEPFQRFGVNLTKLESRPSRRAAWDYFFFVDVEGHADDAAVRAALDALQAHALDVKILGSYPAAGQL